MLFTLSTSDSLPMSSVSSSASRCFVSWSWFRSLEGLGQFRIFWACVNFLVKRNNVRDHSNNKKMIVHLKKTLKIKDTKVSIAVATASFKEAHEDKIALYTESTVTVLLHPEQQKEMGQQRHILNA